MEKLETSFSSHSQSHWVPTVRVKAAMWKTLSNVSSVHYEYNTFTYNVKFYVMTRRACGRGIYAYKKGQGHRSAGPS